MKYAVSSINEELGDSLSHKLAIGVLISDGYIPKVEHELSAPLAVQQGIPPVPYIWNDHS